MTVLSSAVFSGKRAAEIVGITYRQLDYWARTDLIRPTVCEASGSGSRRRYSHADLVALYVVKELLAGGIRLEVVRRVFNELFSLRGDSVALTEATLVIDRGGVTVVRDDAEMLAVLRQGQGMVNLLNISSCVYELNQRIAEEARAGWVA